MEPLADAERGSVIGELSERAFRRAVFAQQAHVKMTIIRRPFGLAMPRRRGPCARQVVKTVPVDSFNSACEQFRRAPQAEFLYLFGAECRDADFRNPHR